jgi:hypothetical protein
VGARAAIGRGCHRPGLPSAGASIGQGVHRLRPGREGGGVGSGCHRLRPVELFTGSGWSARPSAPAGRAIHRLRLVELFTGSGWSSYSPAPAGSARPSAPVSRAPAGSGGWRRRQFRVSFCPSARPGRVGPVFRAREAGGRGFRLVGRVAVGGIGGSRVPREWGARGCGGLAVRLPGETETDSGGDRLRPFSTLATKPPNPRYR